MPFSLTEDTGNFRQGPWMMRFVEVTETNIGAADEYTIPGLPVAFEIAVIEAELVNAGPGLTQIQPAFGTTPGFTDDTIGFSDEVAAADAGVWVRVCTPLPIISPGPTTLVGRSTPDGPAADVTTRLLFRWDAD